MLTSSICVESEQVLAASPNIISIDRLVTLELGCQNENSPKVESHLLPFVNVCTSSRWVRASKLPCSTERWYKSVRKGSEPRAPIFQIPQPHFNAVIEDTRGQEQACSIHLVIDLNTKSSSSNSCPQLRMQFSWQKRCFWSCPCTITDVFLWSA